MVEIEIIACDNCGTEINTEDSIHFNGGHICQQCFDNDTVICEECGERIWRYDTVDGRICLSCYNEHYTRCHSCGILLRTDDAYYEDGSRADNAYCSCCYDNLSNSIHDYYFKPNPIFYGSGKRYFGVELEIDDGGEDEEYAEDLLDIANSNSDTLYIKHDGSLLNGFELVTHPMTLDYHMRHMPWPEIMRRAIRMNYRSHQSGTCGLHVHINRNALGHNYDEQEGVIAKILYFYEKFWDEILCFSRRTSYQVERWAKRYGGGLNNPKDTLEHAKNSRLGRYVAVNLENSDTIEMRIFRGTLKYNTFIATLQFVDEICNVAITLSDAEIQRLTWLEFVKGICKDRTEIITYLKERQLYVNEPVDTTEEV